MAATLDLPRRMTLRAGLATLIPRLIGLLPARVSELAKTPQRAVDRSQGA